MSGGHACVIGARAGSVRLPGKNKLPLAGKPLWAWTVEAALEAGIYQAVVFTTDDEEIIAGLAAYPGVRVHRRPPGLAGPRVVFWEVVVRLLADYPRELGGARALTVLSPCHPFRRADHLRRARELFEAGGCDAVASVTPFPLSPALAVRVEDGLVRREGEGPVRSGDHPLLHYPNGCVSLAATGHLRRRGTLWGGRTAALEMAWPECLDIDYPADYRLAQRLAGLPGLLAAEAA
jgi:CMP-N-acetylneuraminic acid synthetase